MGKVVNIDGEEVADPVSVEKVLKGAKDCDHIVIAGWRGDDFYLATSEPDLRDVLLLIEIAHRGIMDRIFKV